MARVALFVCLQLCLVLLSHGKTFDRCGLARELNRQGFPRSQLADWVCLVEAESSRRTDVIGPPNADGSRDHGLFQINDFFWCEDGPRPGKACHVKCSDVRTDDITAASKCAKKIFKEHRFNAWVGWVNKCMDKALPDLSPCGF